MTSGTCVRLVAAALAGLAAGAAAWSRVAPLEPLLDVSPHRTADPSVWEVTLAARGDDAIAAISAAPGDATVHVDAPASIDRLEPGTTAVFTVRVRTPLRAAPPAVRLTWTPGPGAAPRISDFALVEAR